MKEHLRVLDEGLLVIAAPARPVAKWVIVTLPGAPLHSLLPGLVDTQVGRVDETTEDDICEVCNEVVKIHPEGRKRRRWAEILDDEPFRENIS